MDYSTRCTLSDFYLRSALDSIANKFHSLVGEPNRTERFEHSPDVVQNGLNNQRERIEHLCDVVQNEMERLASKLTSLASSDTEQTAIMLEAIANDRDQTLPEVQVKLQRVVANLKLRKHQSATTSRKRSHSFDSESSKRTRADSTDADEDDDDDSTDNDDEEEDEDYDNESTDDNEDEDYDNESTDDDVADSDEDEGESMSSEFESLIEKMESSSLQCACRIQELMDNPNNNKEQRVSLLKNLLYNLKKTEGRRDCYKRLLDEYLQKNGGNDKDGHERYLMDISWEISDYRDKYESMLRKISNPVIAEEVAVVIEGVIYISDSE